MTRDQAHVESRISDEADSRICENIRIFPRVFQGLLHANCRNIRRKLKLKNIDQDVDLGLCSI